MTEKLPPLRSITRLSPLVIRILGDNPGKFTLQGTNTYLVGRGRARILIDTGEGRASWADSLRRTLAAEHAELRAVLLTHWHPDHVGGVRDARSLAAGVKVHKMRRPDYDSNTNNNNSDDDNGSVEGGNTTVEPIADGQEFAVEGATLRAFHCPGHTTDHMGFVLAEEDAMFTGDNVLGHGTAVFEDLGVYVRSLESMRVQFGGRAYPGHGEVVEAGPRKIQEYIAHRREREEQIVEAMRGDVPDEGDEGWRSMGIVKVVYREYPEHLHGPAEGGVVQVLKKLHGDGRVRRCDDGTWKLTGKTHERM